ncbi:hypothetical protein BD779DRAFT_233250 [Infundibulicybe gibba]|nr:hypothetical protein BD779DRAFT_233250 [Infundibulicybe gibba]
MKAKKRQRAQVLLSAAHITVETLHDLCFKCVVGADCAAHFYGSTKVPTALNMTVLCPKNCSLSHTALANTILIEDPQHYYQNGKDLMFVDGTLPQGGKNSCKNSCKVTFTIVDGDLAFPVYRHLSHSLPLPPLSFLILLKLEAWATIPEVVLKSPGRPNPAGTKAVSRLLDIDPPQGTAHVKFTTFGEWNLERFEAVAKRYSSVSPKLHARWKLHFTNIFQFVDQAIY